MNNQIYNDSCEMLNHERDLKYYEKGRSIKVIRRKYKSYFMIYQNQKKKSTSGNDFFMHYLSYIDQNYKSANAPILLSMGVAVQGIGHRNKFLHEHALELAKMIGPIDFPNTPKLTSKNVKTEESEQGNQDRIYLNLLFRLLK
jgi:hypothetical protein